VVRGGGSIVGAKARRALLVLLVVVLCGVSGSQGRKRPSVDGGKLTFKLHDLDGNAVTSKDERFKGKVVFVDLFGTWCPPCLRAIPTFRDLQAKYGDQGFMMLGIAFEYGDNAEERRSYLQGFTRHNGIDYLVLDGGGPGRFATALPGLRGVKGLPVEILIGRDGTVIDARNGYVDKKRWAEEVEARIVEALKAKPPAGPVTPVPSDPQSAAPAS
jgi:thiol-disulfide isomerase/thioredoxin